MLGHPISLLSSELIDEIVDCVTDGGSMSGTLALLRADRAFGPRCRAHLYQRVTFRVGRSWKLPKFQKLLEINPSISRYIQSIGVYFTRPDDLWSAPNADFEHIMHVLAKNPQPPTRLHIMGPTILSGTDEPHHFHQWFLGSFFPSSLRELDLHNVVGLLPEVLGRCTSLQSLKICSVGVTKSTPNTFTGEQRGPIPELDVLDSTNSYQLVQNIAGSNPDSTLRIASLRTLRVLKVCPEDKKEMSLVQNILNQASSTLQNLHFSNFNGARTQPAYLPIAGFVDLQHLQQLRMLEMRALIWELDSKRMRVISDFTHVLSTIPTLNNHVQNIVLDLSAYGPAPWVSTRNQGWAALTREIIRISSSGRTVKFKLKLESNGMSQSRRDTMGLYTYLDGILKAELSVCDSVEYHSEISSWSLM
ncbi:hypothetical protein BKA70DRAFT_1489362 [Coprinopsis sp. MPI-PUGE-AT-0042]|nr:hypothetical protein BKA70DRAFT_1489362 [Coprinopsis sp. MPI-PUGE-AT-0042]